MPSIDPRIFRAYDIRGVAHEQLTVEACRIIAQMFGTELSERYKIDMPRVCVGRDARTHGPAFEAAVVEGLNAAGCEVLQIGQTPSPVNYFTICNERLDGGVQVSASHNPPRDNGLKLSIRNAEAYAGADLERLRNRCEREEMRNAPGKTREMDAEMPYLEAMQRIFPDAASGLRIAIDSGNGVAGPLYTQAIRNAGAEITSLYLEPDGHFPNHLADPSKHETLVELQERVREEKLEVGLAFDGDGDRLGVVDETGKVCTADEILLLFAKDYLSRFPGAPVVFTVSSSGVLESEIAKWGGKPVLSKVGHSFVEHTMQGSGASVGGEQSGHFFLAENYYGFDDALVAALRLLAILRQSGKTLSALFAEFPKVYQMREKRPTVADEKKAGVIARVTEHYKKTHPVLTLDGARIDFGDNAWAGIRQSNTTPSISICIEARTEEKLQEVENEVLSHLQTYPEIQW